MNKVFQFKQFSVDQTDCVMKVNTDAVLLGALSSAEAPGRILEIGTGTGVVALMLAQRYPQAMIDAVEIDPATAVTASLNFRSSPFTDRLAMFTTSFQEYLEDPATPEYDLIVSNPPYFINSLKSSTSSGELARHTGPHFFRDMLDAAAPHLAEGGRLCLILPLDTCTLVENIAAEHKILHVSGRIFIHSFTRSEPYRCILTLERMPFRTVEQKFVIYESQGIYTAGYRELLKDFLIIF